MANGMSGLYVGMTGVRSNQIALNATAHNLANINTEGYTRQQVTFEDTVYMPVMTNDKVTTPVSGLGVSISEVRRIRDTFIDASYRSENSRLGFYDAQYQAVNEIEDLFGEMQGVTYQSYLTDLYNSLNELTKNPTSTVARSSLIQTATAFIDKSEAIYEGLITYQTTLNTEVRNMVTTINDLGQTIYSYNKKITAIEAAGVEHANDLRDERDKAIDELSKYMDLDYYEGPNGEIIINAEGVPFVSLNEVAEMSTEYVTGTSLVIPTWPCYDREVFTATSLAKTSNETDTDKGQLKGLILSRGNMVVDYTYVAEMPSSSDYDLTTAEGLEEYNKDYAKYEEKQEYYNTYILPSQVLTAMAGFDYLVNGIVTALNDILCPEKEVTLTSEYTDSDGNLVQADKYIYTNQSSAILYNRFGEEVAGTQNSSGSYDYDSEEKLYSNSNGDGTGAVAFDSVTYSLLDLDKTDYGMDDDRTVGQELFSRANTERYVVTTDSNGDTIYIRNNLNDQKYESYYRLGNLSINSTVAQDLSLLPLSTVTDKEDFERANELVDAWDVKFGTFNIEEYSKSTFNAYYNNFVGKYATWGDVLNSYVANQENMVNGYDNQRTETTGVSSDEELQKMIKFQHAYNASSRYVNVVSEMLEHLVTSLGAI